MIKEILKMIYEQSVRNGIILEKQKLKKDVYTYDDTIDNDPFTISYHALYEFNTYMKNQETIEYILYHHIKGVKKKYR
jgi:hypothetical protein